MQILWHSKLASVKEHNANVCHLCLVLSLSLFVSRSQTGPQRDKTIVLFFHPRQQSTARSPLCNQSIVRNSLLLVISDSICL